MTLHLLPDLLSDKRRPLGLLAVVITAVAVGKTQAAPISPSPDLSNWDSQAEQPREMQQALLAFKRGDAGQALKHLESFTAQHPEFPRARVMLASMYFSENQVAQGRQMLELAVIEDPTDPEPHLIFGDFAFRDRRLSDAEVQYEKGGQLAKSYRGPEKRKQEMLIRAIAGLASVAETRGQLSTAEERLSTLLKRDPKNANAHFRLGNVLFKLGRPEETLASLEKAAELSDSAPSPMLTMAELCRQASKLDEAEEWMQRALESSPDDPQALIAMARWQLEIRNSPAAALPYVKQAEELAPDSVDAKLLNGMIAWRRGDLSLAERLFEAIALQHPENLAANNGLVGVLAEQEDGDKQSRAFQLAQVAISAGGKSADALATLGWAAYHVGKIDDAAKYLQAAVAKGAGRDASYYLARVLYRQGQVARANEALEQALSTEGLFIHLDAAEQWRENLNLGNSKN